MQVRLSSGNYNIIASGESFLFGPFEDMIIQVNDGDEDQVRIVLRFTEDASDERDIKTDVVDDSLVITCVNFSSMGTGLKHPAHIANVNGKAVYFIFSSNYFGDKEDKARSVKYTIFMEK